MFDERHYEQRHAFTAAAEVEHSAIVRKARVNDLCIHGCYLAMPDSFPKGASVLVKIRTEREFFQCYATVAHSSSGIGMGLEFDRMSPPFQIVLQEWLLHALQSIEIR
jgi:hypothetical protein